MRPARGLARLVALLPMLAAGCMATGPEARRAAYLDCARDQGLTVSGGTIVTRNGADFDRLDACEAIPRQ